MTRAIFFFMVAALIFSIDYAEAGEYENEVQKAQKYEDTNRETTYSNPVLVEVVKLKNANSKNYFAKLGIGDPAVIYNEGKYYLYPTGDNHSFNVYISTDLVHWTKGPKIFHSDEAGAWAPDVFHDPVDGNFYLYYTVDRHVGVAVADSPDGTFKDRGFLVDGAIDAHMFIDDDGKYYLYYVKYPAFSIYVQPMETPLRKKDDPVQIISPSESWEKKLVPITEAPWMVKRQGTYYLLYSGGSADTQHYAIGYATAQRPIGPFTKHRDNPIIKEGDGIFGPGHGSVIKDADGQLWLVYHQQHDATRGWNRIICIDRLWFDERGVLHGKATRSTPQPLPATASNGAASSN